MNRVADDGYPAVAPQPRWDGPLPPDVRLYRVDGVETALCISCAVRRRMDGAAVELESGRLIKTQCRICGGSNV